MVDDAYCYTFSSWRIVQCYALKISEHFVRIRSYRNSLHAVSVSLLALWFGKRKVSK